MPNPALRRRWQWTGAAVLLVVVALFALGEASGWPFLRVPLQNFLTRTLHREVSIRSASLAEAAPGVRAFSVHFLGALRVHAAQLEIAAPDWSQAPHLLLAQDVALDLRYRDLWRAWRGKPLRIQKLRSATLDAQLERTSEGRVSWQFGPKAEPVDPATQAPRPLFVDLQVADGKLHYVDVPLAIDVVARLSLRDASLPAGAAVDLGNAKVDSNHVLEMHASGTYRERPLKFDMHSSGALPWVADEAVLTPVPVTLDAVVGRASLHFKGTAADALHLKDLSGRFTVAGPSLAAVGDPLGVTLPTTNDFRMDGLLVKRDKTWKVVVSDATVGASKLNGAFTYVAGGDVPLLSGRLGGSRLLLADLGPAVGTAPAVSLTGVANANAKATPTKGEGHVLPDRKFDLPALSAMDANVLIDLAEVNLNTTLLEPLKPLHTHLQLVAGVLTLRDLDARTAQGRLRGELSLDGRASQALWKADMRWNDVQLERWIHQARANGAPPYVSGRLTGEANVKGTGRSTAEILATLNGHVRTELRDGTISHLAVEAAGLDIAQSLGMIIKGDDSLAVQCAVADLAVQDGMFRPRAMVIDTRDSAIWVDGSLSLSTEVLDLRAVVLPKDFSPMAVRSPLHVGGVLAHPAVSVEKGPMGRKLAASFLLGLINPLAALIPLVDPGSKAEANRVAAGCYELTRRSAAARQVAIQ